MLYAIVASPLSAAAARCAVRSMTAAARSSDLISIICPPLQSARDRRPSLSPPVLCRVPPRRGSDRQDAPARSGLYSRRPPQKSRGTGCGPISVGSARSQIHDRRRSYQGRRDEATHPPASGRSRSGRCVTVPAAPNRAQERDSKRACCSLGDRSQRDHGKDCDARSRCSPSQAWRLKHKKLVTFEKTLC
jgi:hypothetical protein